jgi:predicted amidohydrolase
MLLWVFLAFAYLVVAGDFKFAVLQDDPGHYPNDFVRLQHVQNGLSWAAAHSLPLFVVPMYWLDYTKENINQLSNVTHFFNIPLVIGCGECVLLITPLGDLLQHCPSNPATIISTTILGGVVGILTASDLLIPEPSRVHMLQGTELLIVIGGSHPTTSIDFWINTTRTRAMENILPILLVHYDSSSFTIWCDPPTTFQSPRDSNYCGGTVPVPWTGNTGINSALISGGFQIVREQRKTAVWGDAFRRPLAYRPLCYSSSRDNAPRKPLPTPTGRTKLKLALLQLGVEDVKTEEDLKKKALRLLALAKSGGADIALMPEMYSVGYISLFPAYDKSDVTPLFEWMDRATPSVITPNGTDWLSFFAETARDLKMAIGVTYLGQTEGAPTNSLSLVDSTGNVLFTYSKVHTCNWLPSEALTSPGQKFHVADLNTGAGPVRVGGMICYDREQPESARIVGSVLGAELILVPNACFWDEGRQMQLQMRARENAAGIMFTNYAKGHFANGASTIFDAEGNSLITVGSEEGVYMSELDLG